MAADVGWDNGFDPWGQQDCDGEIGKKLRNNRFFIFVLTGD